MTRSKKKSWDNDNPKCKVSNNRGTPRKDGLTPPCDTASGDEPEPPGTAHAKDLTTEQGESLDLSAPDRSSGDLFNN